MTLWAAYPGVTLEDVKERYRQERKKRTAERLLAVKLSYQRVQCEEIARILDRNPSTVRGWINHFNQKGFEGLKDDHIPGRPSTLTEEEVNTLKKNVKKSTRKKRLRSR